MTTSRFNAQQALRTIQALLKMRKDSFDRDFVDAVANRRWSQLAGYHGIREGLAAAARHLASEASSIGSRDDLASLAKRFEQNALECDVQRDTALAQERIQDVAAHDGVGTGWMMAKKVIEDEIGVRVSAPAVPA